MKGRLKLGQLLVNRGVISPEQLATALAAQQEGGARLGTTLVRQGSLDEETLIRTLAHQLKLRVARIGDRRVSDELLAYVPAELAEKHRSLPLFFGNRDGRRVLFVAMEDPSDDEALRALSQAAGQPIEPVLVGPADLEEALRRHYRVVRPAEGLHLEPVPLERLEGVSLGEPLAVPLEIPIQETRAPGGEVPVQSAGADSRRGNAPPDAAESREAYRIARALSQLLTEKGIISERELADRMAEIESAERSGT